MKDLTIGVHVADRSATHTIARIEAAERAGVQVAWLTSGGVARDPLATFAAATASTESIEFGTCILPTFPRHPLTMVQAALVVDDLAPGRLRLGIGPSHEPAVKGTYNLPFDRPLEHLREYVTILTTLFSEAKVSFQGKRLHAEAQIPAPVDVRVMISALRTNAFTLAGELTEGGITWVTPMPHVTNVARPAIEAGAAKAGRKAPPVVVHQPIVVSEDREAVRAATMQQFNFYPRLSFYSAMFQDSGFAEAKEGTFSEGMADAIGISGSPEEVEQQLRELPGQGAGEIIADIIRIPADKASFDRTVEVLGAIARKD